MKSLKCLKKPFSFLTNRLFIFKFATLCDYVGFITNKKSLGSQKKRTGFTRSFNLTCKKLRILVYVTYEEQIDLNQPNPNKPHNLEV